MKIEIPKEYGGAGQSFMHTILAIEELAKIDPATAVFVDVQNTLVINAFMHKGTEEQKNNYLKKFADGAVGAFAITERDSGSDAANLKSTAVKEEGGYRLNGIKHWITNAKEASIFLIFANVIEDEKKSLTAFIVDTSEVDGVSVGEQEQKMGIRASSTCDVILDNVLVPESCILGSIGEGLMVAMTTLTDGRIGIASQMLGLAEGALDLTAKYAQERVQFGSAISCYQGIHFPIAQMATEIHATKLLVYNVVKKRMAGYDFQELMCSASMAKLFASQTADKVVSQCLEIFGGNGFIKENPIEKLYRDAKIGAIYEGTSNIQLRTIAKNFVKIK